MRCIPTLCLLILMCGAAAAQCTRARLEGPGPSSGFGFTVALEGELALVGAPNAATAHLYDARTGTELFQLDAGLGGATGFGRAVGLAGDRAVVSAPKLPAHGVFHLFEIPSGAYLGEIEAPSLPAATGLGQSVALDANRLVAGASNKDGWRGAAYLFDLATPGRWIELTSSQPVAYGVFGNDVDLAGDRVVVSASGENAVYVFDAITGAELHRLTAAGACAEGFGFRVSAHGDQVLVTCSLGSDVYLFDMNSGALLGTYPVPGIGSRSAALTADYLMVASIIPEAIQVIDRTTGLVTRELRPDADEWAGFGWEMAASGEQVLAAGPFWDWAGSGGAAFLIDLCEPMGSSYCGPAAPNSTGLPARIQAAGLDAADADYGFLSATQMPTNRKGYFLASRTQGFVSGPGGSSGNLCLAGGVVRLLPAVLNTGPDGAFQREIDLDGLSVLAGETWNFQAWFRDGPPWSGGSNFTDGVSVVFL
jgi:hypothetical protein